ncbi:MAG: hypothetical protein M3308_06080 [Actinomycetota bacterium]|nr:hypothetical protein [Actinomycetota bacterium]
MTAPPALSPLAEARRHHQSLIAELRWLGRREWELMEQLRAQEAMIDTLERFEDQ